jgi:hypothetical protein
MRELAAKLASAAAALERTVTAFNAAVRPGAFDHENSTTAAPTA